MLNDVAPDDYLAAALMSSASTFSSYCGLSPDPWQHELLTSKAKRMLINCSRQSGKSTTLATLALHTALYKDESMVLMLSPSLRQSGEIFRKCLHVYRSLERPVPADSETALTLSLENGSRIVIACQERSKTFAATLRSVCSLWMKQAMCLMSSTSACGRCWLSLVVDCSLLGHHGRVVAGGMTPG